MLGHTEENIPLHFVDTALEPILLKVQKQDYILKPAEIT